MKDFDIWNGQKKKIHEKIFKGFVNEREIWWCSIGLNVGDEEDGKNNKFERPVLVLKKFNQNIVIAIPLTTNAKNNFYNYTFVHKESAFYVILSQLRLISTKRFLRKIRKIDKDIFEEIKWQIIMKIF